MKKTVTMPGFLPVVVFRYHDHFDVVRQRVHWLRALNPKIAIHGVYGGMAKVPEVVMDLFDTHFDLDLMPELAFRNVDLALLEWYRAIGRDIKFSHVYACEWDLVYTAPLEIALPIPQLGQSLLSGYTPLAHVEWKWDWTNGKKLGPLNEWLEFKRFLADKYHFFGPYFASIGPGAILSREFFDAYTRMELPLLCHDEIRVPLVHAVNKLAVADTGLYPPSWYQPENEAWIRRFNVRKWEVEPRSVAAGVKAGHMAFHPVTKLLDERLLKRLVSRYNVEVSAPPVLGS